MAPYLDCAAYLRSTAQKMRHADNRKIFLAAADRYDQLAVSLEREARALVLDGGPKAMASSAFAKVQSPAERFQACVASTG